MNIAEKMEEIAARLDSQENEIAGIFFLEVMRSEAGKEIISFVAESAVKVTIEKMMIEVKKNWSPKCQTNG